MLAAATVLGLVIGAVIGGLGGGGGVLTVPALVYLLGESARDATTSSVVIVGVTAVVGALATSGAAASTCAQPQASAWSESPPPTWAPCSTTGSRNRSYCLRSPC